MSRAFTAGAILSALAVILGSTILTLAYFGVLP